MYTQFYGLNRKPFQISTDPAFMWFGEKHKEALATLRYGILDNKGFLLLTGDVGTGKTSLINALLQSLGPDVICTSVSDPSLEKLDLFNYIAAAFGMNREFTSKGAFLGHFRNFLLRANAEKKKVLLIIDEAQLLSQEMLEEIRLLSNIEKSDTKLINIFFIGQNEFNEILNRPQNRAVRQRMTLNYNLDPLTPEETERYISHRLKVAGTTETLFDRSAVQEIFLYSGGFPRRINILCDHALLSGYVKEHRLIDAAIIAECARELKIPAHVRNRDVNGFSEPKTPQAPRPARPQPAPVPQAPAPPMQPMAYPYMPLPQPPNRFPWTGVLIFAAALLLVWGFMFPDHFRTTLTLIKKRVDVTLASFTQTPVPADTSDDNNIQPPPINNQTGIPKHAPSEHTKAPPDTRKSIDIPAHTISQQNNAPTPEKVPEPASGIVEKEIPAQLPAPEPITVPVPPPPVIQETPIPAIEKPALPPSEPIPPLTNETIVIRFQYNTNDFTAEGMQNLEEFSKALAVHPEARVIITGYTDNIGGAKYNEKLSEFRANIVKSFLLGRGVKERQMQVEGRGGENPLEPNDTVWGRKMNRRVEIKLLE